MTEAITEFHRGLLLAQAAAARNLAGLALADRETPSAPATIAPPPAVLEDAEHPEPLVRAQRAARESDAKARQASAAAIEAASAARASAKQAEDAAGRAAAALQAELITHAKSVRMTSKRLIDDAGRVLSSAASITPAPTVVKGANERLDGASTTTRSLEEQIGRLEAASRLDDDLPAAVRATIATLQTESGLLSQEMLSVRGHAWDSPVRGAANRALPPAERISHLSAAIAADATRFDAALSGAPAARDRAKADAEQALLAAEKAEGAAKRSRRKLRNVRAAAQSAVDAKTGDAGRRAAARAKKALAKCEKAKGEAEKHAEEAKTSASRARAEAYRPDAAAAVSLALSRVEKWAPTPGGAAGLTDPATARNVIQRAALEIAQRLLPWGQPIAVSKEDEAEKLLPPGVPIGDAWKIGSTPGGAYSLACYLVRWRGARFADPFVEELLKTATERDDYLQFATMDPELATAPDRAGFALLKPKLEAEWKERETKRAKAKSAAAPAEKKS